MNITTNKNWYKIKSFIPKKLYDPILDIYYCIQGLRYIGNEYYCPVCQSYIKKFNHKKCPKCGADVRHRTLWMFLSRKTDFFINKLYVLHIAPEHCLYKILKKSKNIEYLSADLGSPRAMLKIDITNMSLPDNAFDVLISSHVLEHVDDDIKAMKELCRVQKENGWSVHLVPIDYSRTETYEDPMIKNPEERINVYGHYDHKRIYGTDYKKRLESAGFIVRIYKTEEYCDEKEILQLGLNKETNIFYCTK